MRLWLFKFLNKGLFYVNLQQYLLLYENHTSFSGNIIACVGCCWNISSCIANHPVSVALGNTFSSQFKKVV